MDDLFAEGGALQLMLKKSMETMLKAELEDHLGYPHRDSKKSKRTLNSRIGSYKKSVKTTTGKLDLDIPRDRDGTFEPKAVPKYEGVGSKLEEQIISMYAKGMTTRDIETHVKEIYYGLEISPTAISNITEKILDHAKGWQTRPLNELYPVVFFDAIHYKVRVDGKIICKAAYTCLGIDKNGLKGFPEAISSIFPKTEVQTCIVHQIRNLLKYVGSKHQKDFMKDLKLVYQAATEEMALKNLDDLAEKWGEKYPVVVNSWKSNWSKLSTYFKYSQPIRKIIYTTNIVENLHRQMRKVTKKRAVFPTDDSLSKLLYLAVKDVTMKWTTPKWNWGQVIAQLSIHFEDRVELDII